MYPTLDDLDGRLTGDIEGHRFLKFLRPGPLPAHDASLGPCVIWGGALSSGGYGIFFDGHKKKKVGAHRWLHERLHGPVPTGLEVHHVCHDPRVCAPERARDCPHRACVVHTAPATRRQNVLAGGSFAAVQAAKTRCEGKYAPPGGHDLTDPANVYITPGTNMRHCIPCTRESDRLYQARKRARLRAQAAQRAGQLTLM